MEQNSRAKPERQLCDSCRRELAAKTLHAARHPSSQCSFARSIAIVTTCTAALVLHTSNVTSVSISLPLIGKAVGIEEDQLQWLISAYTLSSGCMLLFFGHLADLYGRKKGFVVGMLWQVVFALGLGFANDGLTLDILRGFQGMGAAAAIPSALGILAESFPHPRARSIAFATFAAGAPIGGAFGNIIGALLTQLSKEHWRATFWLTSGLSALCVLGALTSFYPDNISTEADARVDWIGAFLVTAGLVLIVFVLGQGPTVGWKTPYIIACLIAGVVLVGIFIAWEHHLEKSAIGPEKLKSIWTPPPLMKLSIWARAKGRMAAILVVAFLNWSGFISWIFWAQLYYQNYLELTPVLSMVRFMPMFVAGCLCNFFVAMVISRLPFVVIIVLGTAVTGFACVLFALIDPSATYWKIGFPSTIMIVFGADIVYTAGTIFVAKLAFPHEQSLAGGLFQTMTQIGTAFGLTISTIVCNAVTNAQSTELGMFAKLQGYRSAQWTSAAFPFFASLLAAISLREIGIMGRSKQTPQDTPEQKITTG